jgi:mono/diheme cytochrome c family protein
MLRWLVGVVVVVALGMGTGLVWAWRSAIDPVAPPAPETFDAALVARGAQLAAVGNCIACHTVPGGRSFAGGLSVPTPFGTVHSTNITPDPDTGIGRWSEAAFVRAMREGVDRAGNHLYPAFPYDHFTKVTDADNRALYAYLMTRRPVRATAPANTLPFPLNIRLTIAAWKLLYFRPGVYQPDPGHDAVWNRGAYLAESLGHCGACHTPRNALGAERADRHWAGGEAEGWTAYPIDAGSPAPVPWTAASLAFYLRNGWHEAHGVSRGPMAEVTGNLAGLPDADVAAIAAYTADRMGAPTPKRLARAEKAKSFIADDRPKPAVADAQVLAPTQSGDRGATIYAAACAVCHESGRSQPYGGLNFHLSTAVHAATPQNIVNVTLFGLPPADGEVSAIMPAFAAVLSDADMAALLAYLRRTFTDQPPWPDLDRLVRDTRSGAHPVRVRPADGIERAPRHVAAED